MIQYYAALTTPGTVKVSSRGKIYQKQGLETL